jgi:hypothetical protein
LKVSDIRIFTDEAAGVWLRLLGGCWWCIVFCYGVERSSEENLMSRCFFFSFGQKTYKQVTLFLKKTSNYCDGRILESNGDYGVGLECRYS